jgi:hypothetical protein
MIFAGVFAVVVGTAMIAQWTVTIARKQVPGLDSDSVSGRGLAEMLFHWAAEFGTAAVLLAGGIGLLLDAVWASKAYLVAVGMLLYTVVNSPGYFTQRREWPMVGMFGVIFVLALVSLIWVL